MQPARLFVSDVDGTLVNRKAQLSASTRARLTSLLEQGLPFTVASARSAYTLRVLSTCRSRAGVSHIRWCV